MTFFLIDLVIFSYAVVKLQALSGLRTLKTIQSLERIQHIFEPSGSLAVFPASLSDKHIAMFVSTLGCAPQFPALHTP